jgi:transcriptional regulator with GAF, ATPase, and Fis domain
MRSALQKTFAAPEASRAEEPCGVLGDSPAMRRIFALLPRLAATQSTVLIEGETGTGKTLLAEAIHRKSARSDRPFVVVDCASIPAGLIESELFGHEKGAFTGAHAARIGAFEAAQGGTVFLDELGELPLELQPKLLRVLEERAIKRVGTTTAIPINVRVIAATNRDLRDLVESQRFRLDLYYRLNTVRLRIPPLRERREDIALLATHFWARATGDDAAVPPGELLESLLLRPWPGNVRELRGLIDRAVTLGDAEIDDEPPMTELPGTLESFDPAVPFRVAKERAVARWEGAYLKELIGRHQGNLTHAARSARMDRNYLRELLARRRVQVRDRGDS